MVKKQYKYLLEFMDNEVSFVYFNVSFLQTFQMKISYLWSYICMYVSGIVCENRKNNVFLHQS